MYFGFSSLLKIRESKGDMHGIKGCRETHSLSHLLFVDDYFLFCRIDEKESNILKDVLDSYGKVSHQHHSISQATNLLFFGCYQLDKQGQISWPSFHHWEKQ